MPGALSGRDLDDVRRDVEATWPGTAIVSAPGTALDAEGGWIDAHTPVGTVRALLHPEKSQTDERVTGEQLRENERFILSCPWDTPLGSNHVVSYEGVDYQVVTVREWGPASIAARAVVSRIGP